MRKSVYGLASLLLSAHCLSASLEVTEFQQTLKAAQAGKTAAQYAIGGMYESGWGVEQDLSQALDWYRQAAEKGHVDAQYRIGYSYYRGLGGAEQDYSLAHRWFLKAAEGGSQSAQRYLGEMYSRGLGVDKDEQQAQKWFARAAESDLKVFRAVTGQVGSKPNGQAAATKRSQNDAQPPQSDPPKPVPARARSQAKAKNKPVKMPATSTSKSQSVTQANVKKPPVETAVDSARKAQRVTQARTIQEIMKTVLSGRWSRHGIVATRLPSSLTSCTMGNNKATCWSNSLSSEEDKIKYIYKVKTLLKAFESNGQFQVVSRKLVTDVFNTAPSALMSDTEEEEIGGLRDDILDRSIRLGWSGGIQEMGCELKADDSITCLSMNNETIEYTRSTTPPESSTPAPGNEITLAEKPQGAARKLK